MKRKWVSVFFIVFVLINYFNKNLVFGAEGLTVAVSANVQFAFKDLKSDFEKNTGIRIKSIIGSSGQLTSQIENGAPFDVFLSADMEYSQFLHDKGLTVHEPRIYAYGVLVLWTTYDLKLSSHLKNLTDFDIQNIAISSPRNSPYGQASIQALQYYHLDEVIKKKLVYGESVSQTNQFILSGASDIGMTSKSVVLSPFLKGKGTWIEIDKESYQPIAQSVVVLNVSKSRKLVLAQQFYDFLFTKKAQNIFKNYGYVLPEG